MSMPDTWEYPWFAAWDMAFHCVALAHVDPAFAKYQLTLLCREWFQHPNGAMPAYEWAFDDVNPPVQALAALEVFAIDGGRDIDFLSRIFDKLLVNFTWWVNRQDEDGSNVFEGGFLGLDNIGPIDRSHLPPGYTLEQSDATGWMASYALSMAAIASILNRHGRPTTDLVVKFLEHFALISDAIREKGLWDDEDGFYYDQLRQPDGTVVPVRVRSMVGILPLTAFAVIDEPVLQRAQTVGQAVLAHDGRAKPRPRAPRCRGSCRGRAGQPTPLARRRGSGAPVAHLHPAVRRGRVPLAVRAAGALSLAPRAPLPPRGRRDGRDDRLRAGRVDDGNVRWELELARTDLVPGQLPPRQRAASLRALLRR